MKKIFSVYLSLILILTLSGCNQKQTDNNFGKDTTFSQTMTIVTMSSPPKCKTTTNITTINKVLTALEQAEKIKSVSNNNKAGWHLMVKINIDGTEFNYTIGGSIFTDIDGKQYEITNAQEIEENLKQIYNNINEPERQYH
ncbi:MAG: hypothetical protein Q4B40_03915 [Clostridia bacterium]|nr:hypothetical protein [Clostridia bacterium]